MLSGIGPRDHLESLGIEVLEDLPGVGANFHDHIAVPYVYYSRTTTGIQTNLFQVWSLSRFELSCQLLMNEVNQVLFVYLLITCSQALANEGLLELTRRPLLTGAVSALAETPKESGCSQVERPTMGLYFSVS